MRIFDMHIHADGTPPNPEGLLETLEQAGIFGGAVFSVRPEEALGAVRAPYEKRIRDVMEWVRGYEDRLFPVLWIHPFEKNALEIAEDAAARGIAGFKLICDTYAVNQPEPLRLLERIASLHKPVFFHSGILWNAGNSSVYNRPVLWEALVNIPNLRFSMGHCSWPWHDECIALYGTILNGYVECPERSAEMFFDLTPGTPPIYRRELLYKLFHVGYDVPYNIMFGTDCSAGSYNVGWARDWLARDGALFDAFGVDETIRELIYSKNLMRFLGRDSTQIAHLSPVPGNGNDWSLEREASLKRR